MPNSLNVNCAAFMALRVKPAGGVELADTTQRRDCEEKHAIHLTRTRSATAGESERDLQ